MRLYRVRRYLERTGGEQTRTARAYYQRHQRARRSVMAEAVVFKVCLKKMKRGGESSGCSFWVQCVPHWQLVYVCVCVGVTPACTVACLHVLILWCLLIEWRGVTQSLLGSRPQGLSTTVTQPSQAPPNAKQRQAATAAWSKGTIAPPVFNLCYSFSLSHLLSFACTISPSTSSSSSPSSKHFWLFCFPALQRVIAHDNDHGRLFSLRSPASVCMPG